MITEQEFVDISPYVRQRDFKDKLLNKNIISQSIEIFVVSGKYVFHFWNELVIMFSANRKSHYNTR